MVILQLGYTTQFSHFNCLLNYLRLFQSYMSKVE